MGIVDMELSKEDVNMVISVDSGEDEIPGDVAKAVTKTNVGTDI